MKILVTGGAGYIGSILVPILLKSKHKVIVLDNFIYNQNSLLDCCYDKRLTIIRADTRDKPILSRYLKQVDAVFPLACLTGAPLCNKRPKEAQETIVDTARTITKIRSRSQIIIFPTTNSGYGIGQKNVFCTEKTPLRPISLYGRLKVEAERIFLEAGNSITLRLATAFGSSPRMRLDLLVNDFVYRAVNDRFIVLFQAHFKRNYIHVRDIARSFLHCLNKFPEMKNRPYNVGLSNANLNKLELCQRIKRQISDFYFTEAEVGEDPDKRDYIVSNAEIEASGFKPAYSLDQGIKELIRCYQIIKRNQFSNA